LTPSPGTSICRRCSPKKTKKKKEEEEEQIKSNINKDMDTENRVVFTRGKGEGAVVEGGRQNG